MCTFMCRSAHESINEINFGGYGLHAGFASELRYSFTIILSKNNLNLLPFCLPFNICSEPNKEASIFLGDIYPSTTVENILDDFSQFGSIMSISIKYRSDSVNAFVEFCCPQ